MIPLSEKLLPVRSARYLEQFQAEINTIDDYTKRIDVAKRLWSQKRQSAPATFRDVRDTLMAMHRDDPHCYYCGYSRAREIEHFRPKAIFPELTFVWDNYLYCCSDCNVFKSSKFAVFSNDSTVDMIGVDRSNAPLTSPPAGDSVLIDPRRENPANFLLINLASPGTSGHCLYRPIPSIDQRAKIRVEYTLAVLGLNDRDYLTKGRQSAFVGYRDVLSRYVAHKRAARNKS